jgi:hypothetical protein
MLEEGDTAVARAGAGAGAGAGAILHSHFKADLFA